MKIILDTNFLIYCAKEKLDYEEELSNMLNEDYELVAPLQVIEELKKVKEKKKEKIPLKKRTSRYKKTTGKDKLGAELAIQILEKKDIKKIDIKGKNVDEAIINLAKQDKKNIVCTLDKEIRGKLGRVILISKGKKLRLVR
jgi:rRNA-processing protein FCF1